MWGKRFRKGTFEHAVYVLTEGSLFFQVAQINLATTIGVALDFKVVKFGTSEKEFLEILLVGFRVLGILN